LLQEVGQFRQLTLQLYSNGGVRCSIAGLARDQRKKARRVPCRYQCSKTLNFYRLSFHLKL
jgi:hypothetical protein